MKTNEFFEPSEITEYIKFHKELNPKLWMDNKLRSDVRNALLKNAKEFVQFLELDDFKFKDVIFTGSNAAYNYTSLSDMDIHIIVNFENTICPDLADNFFNTKRYLWNENHETVKVRGYHVELYVEDSKHSVNANGIYSLIKNDWIKKPKPVEPTDNDIGVVNKTNDYADKIEKLLENDPTEDKIEDLLHKLKAMRQSGLAHGGEFSIENLTYKSLRNLGLLDKLHDMQSDLETKELSLESLDESIPLSMARPYVKNWNKDSNKELFQKFSKYALDDNLYRLKFPVKEIYKEYDGEELDKCKMVLRILEYITPRSIENMSYINSVKATGIKLKSLLPEIRVNIDNPSQEIISDYKDGYITLSGQKYKIGKILNNAITYFTKLSNEYSYADIFDRLKDDFTEAMKAFTNDPIRSLSFSKKQYSVILSRHPYDIASMSTGRGWESCMNLVDGSRRHLVKDDIKNGSIIAYLVNQDDTNIENPISRLTLYKYFNKKDPNDTVFVKGDMYGSQSLNFDNFMFKLLKIINRGKEDGLYCTDGGYYGHMKYEKDKNKINNIN